jgi:two-component system nitrogen regulation sensor histidine kinase NtrY
MAFKNFLFLIIFRILLLTAALMLLSWCIVNELYLRSTYVGLGVIIIVIEMIWYMNRFNRDISTWLTSVTHRDFTTYFQSEGNGEKFDELYEIMNKISEAFRKISQEREIQSRYFEMLFEHVRVGILSIDEKGKVHHTNQTLKDLLQTHVISHLKALEALDPELVTLLHKIKTGETELFKLRINQNLLQLSIHASEFKLDDKYYKLISMQNIRNELDAREMMAWQKLIGVLSHEIMNSVAPIMSLSATLHGMVDGKNQNMPEDDSGLYDSLDKGLEAIKIRSEGLYNFTQTYRKLTGIPKVSLQKINLKEIVQRVHTLMHSRFAENKIRFESSDINVDLDADPELMEHVLINLLVNSIEATNHQKDGRIQLFTSKNNTGNLLIHVKDNGEGMDESTMEKIFIPFFTTKKTGSGIGLAITRQILQQHQADILVNSELGKGTEFTIVI